MVQPHSLTMPVSAQLIGILLALFVKDSLGRIHPRGSLLIPGVILHGPVSAGHASLLPQSQATIFLPNRCWTSRPILAGFL